jgi:hypothetical protein
MGKFYLQFTNTTTYEVVVEAEDESQAYEITKDWGRDDLEEFEVDNRWDIQAWGEVK